MSAFRDWLIERLADSRHARIQLQDSEFDRVAVELGVQADVLAEARMVCKMRLMEAGRQPPLGTKARGTSVYQFMIRLPRVVSVAWDEECTARGQDGTALLRSALHAYLQGSVEPASLGAPWMYRGRRVYVHRPDGLRIRAIITQGSRRALRLRATKLGSTPTAIARGLILKILAGGYRDVPLVEPRRMFDDEKRYNTNPKLDS